jgi:hypothetical protein
LVGSIGVGFCSESLILTIVILLGFVIIYPVTIFNEERKLSAKFGAAYADYVQKVPRFFPKFSLFHEPPVYTIKTKAYRRVIFESMFFIWVVVLFEIFKVLTDLGIIVPLFSIY